MSSVSDKLRCFSALEPHRRRRLLTAMTAALFVRFSIRLRGYRRTRELLARWRAGSAQPPEAEEQARIVAVDSWAIRTTGEQFQGATCLVRSLALWWLLARRGIDSEIRFGVQKVDTELEAHAWLEWQGRPLTDSDDPRDAYSSLQGHRPS